MIGPLFIVFFILLFIGTPISLALVFSAMIAGVVFGDITIVSLAQKYFRSAESFTLMAVPFFILAGNIMARGGVSKRLTDMASAAVGRTTGGLAMVATIACTFFGALSGSAPATAAAIGAVMIPSMIDRGYARDFSTAVCASSGTIGLLIPPSISMVLYSTTAGVSTGKMFLGGIVPGILMCLALMLVEYLISRKNGWRGGEKATLKAFFAAMKNGILPLIILGGIYLGIFTATESAAVAVVYGVVVGAFVYRELNWKELWGILKDTAASSATLMFLVAGADIFSYILTVERIPQLFANTVLGLSDSLLVIELLMMVVLLIAGCFLENAVAILLMTPIFVPTLQQLGADGNDIIAFGVMMTLALAIGQITPPVGSCLFVGCDIGKISIEKLSKVCIPFLLALIAVLFLLVLIPSLITFIPMASGL